MSNTNENKYLNAFKYVLATCKRHKIGYLKGFRDYYHFAVTRKFSPFSIESYDLLSPQWSAEDRAELVSKQEHLENQQRFNPGNYAVITEDKVIFQQICDAVGLPTPTFVAALNRYGDSFAADRSLINSFTDFKAAIERGCERLENGIICKPVYGSSGKGIVGFDYQDGIFTCVDGQFESLESFYQASQTEAKDVEYVIQERIYSHDDIKTLTGKNAIQGLRMITVVNDEGESQLIIRKFKMAGHSGLLDNFGHGETGAIVSQLNEQGQVNGSIMYSAKAHGMIHIEKHPVTGNQLEGFQIPNWDQCVALALKAQQIFKPHKSIGWDVAITNDGVYLLEGNIYWDPYIPDEAPMKSIAKKYGIYR